MTVEELCELPRNKVKISSKFILSLSLNEFIDSSLKAYDLPDESVLPPSPAKRTDCFSEVNYFINLIHGYGKRVWRVWSGQADLKSDHFGVDHFSFSIGLEVDKYRHL